MKKLFALSLISLAFITACDDSTKTDVINKENAQSEQTTVKEDVNKQALLPEAIINNVPFTKNEKGTVIFNNVFDMFEEFSLYSLEDKNIKLISEKPLSIQIYHDVVSTENKDIVSDIQDAFIPAVFNVFTFTNTNEIILEAIPVDAKTGKILKKFNIKAKITRDKALEVLQAYSSAKSFDDLVNFDKNDEYNVIGYSHSKLALALRSDKVKDYVSKALVTGKIKTPMEDVIVPLHFDMNMLAAKLTEVSPESHVESRELNDGKKAFSVQLGKIVRLEGIGDKKNDLDYLDIQFGFVSNQDIILNTLKALAIGSLITPNPDKTFKEITAMVQKAGVLMKKQETIQLTKVVDGVTLKLSVYKKMGGLSYFSIKKLEKQPIKFD